MTPQCVCGMCIPSAYFRQQTQGIVPTEGTYVAALAGFERPLGPEGPHMEEVERAFATIAKTGPPIGTSLRQRQAVGYAHAGMWQKAYDLFQPVVSQATPDF